MRSQAGVEVLLLDVSHTALDKGLAGIRKSLERAVENGNLEETARDSALARLKTSMDKSSWLKLIW